MDCLSTVLWLVIGFLSAIFWFFKKRYAYWKDRGVEYVQPTIPFGNLPFRRKVHIKEIIGNIYDKKSGKNPFLGAFFFATPVVVPTDLDFIKSVLIKDFNSFHGRGIYFNQTNDALSANMLSLDGEKWKSLRAKLSPTFTSGRMKFMFPTVVKVADRFNASLADLLEGSATLEMKDLLARFTTDVIGTCAFGIECNSMKTPNSEFRRYGSRALDDPPNSTLLQLLSFQYPNIAKKYFHMRVFKKDVSDFFMNTLKNGGSLKDEHSKTLGKLTIEEVAGQALLFFLAGFETSSTTMMFALYELSLNPDIQEKGRQEIEEVLNKHDGKITYESIKEMVYIDKIISETLRKYPAAPILFRNCTQDFNVPNSDVIIEKGTRVAISAYSIHHDPEIYENPEVFDPERFSPEQVKNRHPVAFLAFGDGPRNCVGLRFGRMQSRIGLVSLLKNYRFKPCEKTPTSFEYVEANPLLSIKQGMHLLVEKV
ncbi:probable cytochrome P450 6a13 isoform X2 [Hermetia illucens]|uniref:probable cytochrome P450 6a13 isoform X2 n=1 Tax=Hermetia illucens TaxID=343691 RepID=UPI0018CC3AFF|nr:probable cytochrome P450 6a13 isoform X2 [Hermetia illucens]